MNGSDSFRRLAGLATLVSLPLSVGSGLLLALATNFKAEALLDPLALLRSGPAGAGIVHWAMVVDMLGYLGLAPLALFLRGWLKPRAADLVTLYTLCGLAYILIGAVGAGMLMAALPPMIGQYVAATAPQRQSLEIVFSSLHQAVSVGLWQALETLLMGFWLAGIGSVLQRERRALGLVTRALGVAAILVGAGRLLSLQALFTVGGAGMGLLLPIWAIWIGIDLLRQPARRGGPAEAAAGAGGN